MENKSFICKQASNHIFFKSRVLSCMARVSSVVEIDNELKNQEFSSGHAKTNNRPCHDQCICIDMNTFAVSFSSSMGLPLQIIQACQCPIPPHTVHFAIIRPGLAYNFARGFRRAYIQGEGFLTGLKKSVSKQATQKCCSKYFLNLITFLSFKTS